jgi:hypothetical protein
MTTAQKKNVARFKAAAAEAKKIRAKDPKLTQAEAVKKAFAKLYGVKKTVTKKAVAKKKTATKQPVAKKKTATKKYSEYHKDTMSHNVNIRVMSGISGILEDAQNRRINIINRISKINNDILQIKIDVKNMRPVQRGRAAAIINSYKKIVSTYKKELKIVDAIINENLKTK